MKPVLLATALLSFICLSAQDTTNRGTEFWVGYGHHQFMEVGQSNNQSMTIYLATDNQPATVTITIDSSGVGGVISTWWWRTYTIPANTVVDVETSPATSYSTLAGAVGAIPKGGSGTYDARLYGDSPPIGIGSIGLFRKKAIHIVSNVPIVAYSHIYGSASSGATMLLPVEAWGGLYTSANSNQSYASNCYSWMYVIAKYDNTVVEITPSVKTVGQNYTGLQQGVTKTITLMKGQIYQVLGANTGSDASGTGGTASTAYELTGTLVKSVTSPTGYIHPIAVFSGSSRTANIASCGSGGGDNDMQQHFPRQAMGKLYLTAPFSGSSTPSSFGTSIYKVIVNDPTTLVVRNGAMLTSLVNSSYYTFESNTPDIIQSDKPILVAQYMTGGSCLGTGGLGDPEMIYLNPLSQAIKSANFFRTTKESIGVQYLTAIIPTAGIASLTIDGSSTFDYTLPHPQKPGYSIVVKRWGTATKAQSTIQSDSAFIGFTYGLGSVESYGYSLGTRLNAVNARDASQLPPGFTGGEVLPLNLLDFTAVKKEKDVQLKWNTSNEVGVDKFEVQRSTNGREFNVFATTNSKQTPFASYDATDVNALVTYASDPTLYYRLKMIDKDGSFKYSAVIVVRTASIANIDVKAVPNPFTDKLQLQIPTEITGNAKISIRDVSGKTIVKGTQLVNKGSSVVEITSLAKLQKGVYILELELNGNKQYVKIVK
jgi:hypothetical protein